MKVIDVDNVEKGLCVCNVDCVNDLKKLCTSFSQWNETILFRHNKPQVPSICIEMSQEHIELSENRFEKGKYIQLSIKLV